MFRGPSTSALPTAPAMSTTRLPRRPAPSATATRARVAGRLLAAAFGLAALAPAGAEAQGLASPVVPRGHVRLELNPSVASWDARYGLRVDGGTVVEEVEALASDLTDPRGVALFPGISTLEDILRSLSGDAGFQGSVGSTSARLSREVTRVDMGLRVGVFDWLTVGANVPYVRGRSTLDFAFRADSSANLGLSPGVTALAGVSTFLTGLGEAAVAAQNRAQGLCSAGASAACQSATALAQRAGAFWEGLAVAYFATPLFPLASSAVAQGLGAAFTALKADLAAAGIPGAQGSIPFAQARLDEAAYLGLSTNPAAGIGMTALASNDGAWRLGDVEVGATVRLLEGERLDSGSASPRAAWGLYGGFTARLPTGVLDDPDVFLDLASGDGQMDLEGRAEAMVRVSRVGARAAFRYGTQSAVDIARRVAPHEALLPPLGWARAVRWSPGAYSFVEISPRIHLTEALALVGDFRRFHKAADGYALLPGQEGGPELDLSVLGRESEVTLTEAAVGLRYSSLGLFRRGRVGTPAEAGLRVILPVSGSGGRVPKATTLELSLSLFRRFWG